MDIIGLDSLIFGVEDLDASIKYARDYGLSQVETGSHGAVFEATDGTNMIIRKARDPSLAPAVSASPNIRDTRYGVANNGTLEKVGAELSKDRDVKLNGGVLSSVDDDGYPISFQVTIRRADNAVHHGVNVPGQPPGRTVNRIGAPDGEFPRARSLSHVVLFTRNKLKSEQFYSQRLGFRTVDEFTNLGPFMRPAGTQEHHTLFFIESPQIGLQHFTFHFDGAAEVLKGGWEFARLGYKSHWGPGRHVLGSNVFWYFNSPFGGLMEFDADMDLHDDSWIPRRIPANAQTSQSFLFRWTERWSPDDQK